MIYTWLLVTITYKYGDLILVIAITIFIFYWSASVVLEERPERNLVSSLIFILIFIFSPTLFFSSININLFLLNLRAP